MTVRLEEMIDEELGALTGDLEQLRPRLAAAGQGPDVAEHVDRSVDSLAQDDHANLAQPGPRNASRVAMQSRRASEPALVCRRSVVAMSSFRKIGIPCRGPRPRRAPGRATQRSRPPGVRLEHGVEPRTAAIDGSTRARDRSVRRADGSRPSFMDDASHGSLSRVVITRAILTQHFGASRSFASIRSPGFMS